MIIALPSSFKKLDREGSFLLSGVYGERGCVEDEVEKFRTRHFPHQLIQIQPLQVSFEKEGENGKESAVFKWILENLILKNGMKNNVSDGWKMTIIDGV